MNLGLWFLPAGAVAAVGTILAASLPVPPSLPTPWAAVGPATAPPVAAAAPSPATPVVAATPPAASRSRHAMALPRVPPATAVARARRIAAGAAAARNLHPKRLGRKPDRRLAAAAPERHRRALHRVLAHAVGPRYGAIVREPPGPYPGIYERGPTQIAMGPPPYGMPPPYWRMPYPPR
jgi:hypothetical protein